MATEAKIGQASGPDDTFRIWAPPSGQGGYLWFRAPAGTGVTLSAAGGPLAFQRWAAADSGGHWAYQCDLAGLAPQWVEVSLAASGSLTAGFQQSGHAVESDHGALVPWTFSYWPFAGGRSRQAAEIVGRFARLCHGDQAGREAAEWELQHHHLDGDLSYEGHCHYAANASALFKEPPASVTCEHEGRRETFTRAELKLLAIEYAGNFGREDYPWILRGLADDPLNEEVAGGIQSFLYYVKPGGPSDRASLEAALASDGVENPAAVLSGIGFGDAFQDRLAAAFGQAAGGFLATLQDCLGGRHLPLVGNLRSGHEDDGPSAVWNHALYKFCAEYRETAAAAGAAPAWREMEITCLLHANEDFVEPGDDATPADDSQALVFRHVFSLRFLADGGMDPAHCRWISCRRRRAGGGAAAAWYDVYAPSDLGVILPCRTARNAEGGEIHQGNPHVDRALEHILHFTRAEFAPPALGGAADGAPDDGPSSDSGSQGRAEPMLEEEGEVPGQRAAE